MSERMEKRLTAGQGAILTAYTGVLCGGFSEFHEYAEKLMGRPVWTHEFADRELQEKIKELAKPDFLALAAKAKP